MLSRRIAYCRARTSCVAACYRCLMSYYNQPDHESLDRRDEDARALLLRLARGRTVPRERQPLQGRRPRDGEHSREGRWLAEASRLGIPVTDPVPLMVGDRSVPYVWRRHYVAAVIDEVDHRALQAMEDLGFDVVQFEGPSGWNAAFARLASALGHAS